MALMRHASLTLLTTLAFYLGFLVAVTEAASCPGPRINASEVCEEVGSMDVKSSANLSNVICDSFQNLSQVNRSFVVRALEHVLRKGNEIPLNVIKVLVNQVDGEELEAGLEEFNRKIVNSSLISPAWKSLVLRSLWEEKLRNEDRFNETSFVASWFQKRLRPFIAAISVDVLHCLQNETIRCAQYQAIVKGLDMEFMTMSQPTQAEVFHSFQLPYLKRLNSNGSACTEDLNSTSWMMVNFGRFSRYAEFQDFVSLNSDFNHMDVLQNLTPRQLGQLSATVGRLKTLQDVERVMSYIKTSMLTEYVDEFNRQPNISLPKDVQAGLLKHVLTAAQPILQQADDGEFMVWMERRLPVLIPRMESSLVPLLFDHLESRNCSASRSVVTLLSGSVDELGNGTRQSIYEAILNLLSNTSLQCYTSNSSFSVFLGETFQGFFELLTLKDLRTITPTSDLPKIVNTISPNDLANCFSKTGFLNDDPFLTAVLQNYTKNGLFMDRFNQRDIAGFLPNATKAALLAGVWPTVVSGSTNQSEVDIWLEKRLDQYIVFLNGEILNGSETLDANCVTFQKIVSKLNEHFVEFHGRQEEIYFSIKAYLAAPETKPRCYNGSDPKTSAWLVMFFWNYIRYCSARDMRLLTNHSAAIFQNLAFNPDNLELIHTNEVRKDLAQMYTAALFAVDSDFSLHRLPNQLLCFARHSTEISRLSPAKTLDIVARVNQHCNASRPSPSDRQLATVLVEQVKTFDNQTLVALGRQAVGLTTGQISGIPASVLRDPKVLESLGQVQGWNRGQAQMLVNKILQSNYTLDSIEKFEDLGTLAQGLPSASFRGISAGLAVGLSKSASFVAVLVQGPEHVKKAFVSKILSNASSPRDILDNVPDDFIGYVPNALLVLRGEKPDLDKINEKPWSPHQAAVLFGEVLANTDNYTELDRVLLRGLCESTRMGLLDVHTVNPIVRIHRGPGRRTAVTGFQCNVASKLSPRKLSDLVREVKVKNANLSEEQLSCLARLLVRSNLTTNFTAYPPDVLLFFPLNNIDNQSCEAFYSLASQGNLSLLTNGSTQRSKLVENALSCLGQKNGSLSNPQLRQLGAFVCDMDASTIENSDPGILENLKLCSDLTTSQRAALNVLLSSGKTVYRTPASWDDGTLESLETLVYYINRTIWDSINKEERKVFIQNMADADDSLSVQQKEKLLLFIKAVAHESTFSSRTKRAIETCKSAPITASVLEDSLFMVQYGSAQEFEACLSDEVLKANLALLLEQPLPNDYLSAVKRKLDKIYPGGIPEDQLKLLGSLSRLYNVEEIGKWNVTSGDTLAALLNPEDGAWEMAQIKQVVARYTGLGGILTGPLLDMLGGKYLCYLDEDQLKQIDPEAIRHSERLDISTCSQGKKNLLYGKASLAFASQEGSSAYYPLILPYLGGAPVEDLKKLAGSQVTMDIQTFLNLNPEEVQKLSVQDVKGLLGVNLPALKEVEDNPSVAKWIKSQYQTELDTLGIGLTGGLTSSSSSEARGSVMNVSSPATNESSEAPTSIAPIAEFTIMPTSSNDAPTLSIITSPRHHHFDPEATIESHLTSSFEETPPADDTFTPVDVANTTVHPITIDSNVGVLMTTTTISSDITDTPEEPISGMPASTNGEDLSPTIEDSSSSVLPDSAVDFTMVSITNITDISSNFTTPSNSTIGGPAVPVFVAGDINTTVPSRNEADSNTTTTDETSILTMIDSITAAPNNVTSGGILAPVPTRSMKVTSSVNATKATSNTTHHTSLPDVAMVATSVTTASKTAPAIHTNRTTSIESSTTGIRNLTSTSSGGALTSTKRPPGPLKPSPHAATPAATKRSGTKAPSRTKKPVHPTPNGYILLQPLNGFAPKTSHSWLLLTLTLPVGVSIQRGLL